jgi:hypothetical protein
VSTVGVIFGLAALVCLTALGRHWISESSRKETAVSRHETWRTMSAELPAGSQLTGTELDGQTVVRIGEAREWEGTEITRVTFVELTEVSSERRGGR